MEDVYLEYVGTSQSPGLTASVNLHHSGDIAEISVYLAHSEVHTQTPRKLCALAHKYIVSAGFSIWEFVARSRTKWLCQHTFMSSLRGDDRSA